MLLGGGNRWTDFVRKWADDNKMTYLCAISTPECSAAYKSAKKDLKQQVKNTSFADLKEKAVALASVGLAPKKPRGRPKKYETEAEAKKAKLEQTLVSNRRKQVEGLDEEGKLLDLKRRRTDPDKVRYVEALLEQLRKLGASQVEALNKRENFEVIRGISDEAMKKRNEIEKALKRIKKGAIRIPLEKKYQTDVNNLSREYNVASVPYSEWATANKARADEEKKKEADKKARDEAKAKKEAETAKETAKRQKEYEDSLRTFKVSDTEAKRIIAEWEKEKGRKFPGTDDVIGRHFAAKSITQPQRNKEARELIEKMMGVRK